MFTRALSARNGIILAGRRFCCVRTCRKPAWPISSSRHPARCLANPMLLDWTCGRVLGGLAQVSEADWAQWSRQAGLWGGHALLEKASLEFKRDHDVFGPQRSDWQVMHRVKNEFDPHRIFAPGRLPGRV